MRVAVLGTAGSQEREARLATELNLPIVQLPASDSPQEAGEIDFLFVFRESRLVLQSTSAEQPGELCVDFADAKLNYRAQSSIRSQNIAKALGIKGGVRPSVLDATAGLGKDAFLIASLGCSVALLERSTVVHALLRDGLTRSPYYDDETAATLKRMELRCADLLEIAQAVPQYDVVYLDPMFPARRKSAKVKKDMALLQHLLGHQSDGEQLLGAAKSLARKRVVVKRAKLSAHLSADKPDIEFKGSSSRYDVYLVA